ncbi:hypothetical protein EGR_08564 [Echinococcus granulosus]|uniref:Protein Wnt n=1 Tax=Echinococcus granulosus TaxID=6210 RepID=W6U5Y0_ECHGR|nr:hypothetical protein EGR_08564 [Echinococcus granulosus]EUB56598.1 hypothetical protein EGR_08564 [Echinococcus granulosus]
MVQVEVGVRGGGCRCGGGGPSKGVGEGSFHPIGRVPDIQSAPGWPSQQLSVSWTDLLLLLVILTVDFTRSITWLGLHRYPRTKALEKERFTPNECVYAKYRYGLGRKQLKFCHHPEGSFAMHAVLKSAQAVTYYCPHIFKDRRWNCSSVEYLPKVTPDIARSKLYRK